uniref:Uncharacterized protein n=1 Tax=Lates calcarifer TaxID=8187 RepID=A0A4W6EB52_LATCA
ARLQRNTIFVVCFIKNLKYCILKTQYFCDTFQLSSNKNHFPYNILRIHSILCRCSYIEMKTSFAISFVPLSLPEEDKHRLISKFLSTLIYFLKLTPTKDDRGSKFRCRVVHSAQKEPEERFFTLPTMHLTDGS